MSNRDLTVEAFIALCKAFLSENGEPIPFALRPKENTQDDPFDEFICSILTEKLPNIKCQKSSGPLISPDLVLYREELCTDCNSELLKDDLSRIVAVEVKKLNRTDSGQVARASGLDYNSTPPCGTIRIYNKIGAPIQIRGFYLFVCLEATMNKEFQVPSLILCDGNCLNEDFELYSQAISSREKMVDLGTYGDGANRNRPMFIFSNPLGSSQLSRSYSLITKNDLSGAYPELSLAYNLKRTKTDGDMNEFRVYQSNFEVPNTFMVQEVQELIDTFPVPKGRVSATQNRGRFRLPI